MAAQILYLPINSASLPHYFGRGIILPSKYYHNKPDDLQSSFNGALLLSSNKWLGDADCSLGIVITEVEEKLLIPAGIDFLYFGAFPISRINQVFFKSNEQKKNTVYNINAGTAFLPEHLVQVSEQTSNTLNLPQNQTVAQNDISEKNKRYDILLGGVALMQAAKAQGSNFPKDYFSVLSTFNKHIKEQLLQAERRGLVNYNDFLTGVFLTSRVDTPWAKLQSHIFDTVTTEIVEKLALKDKIKLERKYGMINLENLDQDSPLFILSLLATYGNKKSRSLEELVGILGSFSDEKAEEIALIFGLNVRYSGLRNKYHGESQSIKFKLENRLDYYIIESIYQYVFNNVKDSGKFDYIDSWVPNAQLIIREDVPHYNILDVGVLAKKKSATENLYSEKFEPVSKTLQHHLADFGKNIFEQTKDAFQEEYNQKLRELQAEIVSLKEINLGLENRLSIEVSQASITNDIVSAPIEDSSIKIENDPSDNYDDLELKELKKIAKLKGIGASKISKLKPTKSGLAELINLIREIKTFL